MALRRLLVANRGEVAIRIARAADAEGIEAVMLYAADDAAALHVRAGADAVALPASGPAAYLDIAAVLQAARAAGCDAVHPGYGFLAERADFARACAEAGLAFVGPSPEALETLGDKARARALAVELGVPVLEGTGTVDAAGALAFFRTLPAGAAVALKAVAGGGGRGQRVVRGEGELTDAYAAAAREALAAFGDGALYAERFLERAQHLEVQVAGDGARTLALGDRECSLQRRAQKLVEFAPAPGLDPALREALADAAERLAQAVGYRGLLTVEVLRDLDTGAPSDAAWTFLEANPRLQVEHTVTEEAGDLDLVRLQLRLAAGASLADAGLGARPPPPRAAAVQARVNLETLADDGAVRPTGGTLTRYEPPSGPGVRVDGCGYAGLTPSPAYDSLLAKVIARAPTRAEALRRLDRALGEFRIEGPATNLPLLRALLRRAEVVEGRADTRLVEREAAALNREAAALAPARSPDAVPASARQAAEAPAPEGAVAVRAPLAATLRAFEAEGGERVRAGQPLAVLEAMKMEHVVVSPVAGRVLARLAAPGEVVADGRALLFLAPEPETDEAGAAQEALDPDHIRPDLAEVQARWAELEDAARPEAVARRRRTGGRTARENVADLLDPGSFREFGAFAVAAQRHRRSPEELRRVSPADGLVCGLGTINAEAVGEERARCAALAYDYTVFAGTQGAWNHAKTDRLLHVAAEHALPVVWFAEGGGGRPGDGDGMLRAALNVPTFSDWARLAGVAPRIAVVNGFCFAGNASVAGMADVLIATAGSNLGMAGPAMIEGGGLGVFRPEEIGPVEEQARIGVVDVVARDEAHATALARQALGYAQGPLTAWEAPDLRRLRAAVPENRLRVYDVRAVVDGLFDTGSGLELRPAFAPGLLTGFARLEGRPVAWLANDPRVLGGAVDADGCDKASRLFQLAESLGLPVVSLIDTPGFMVGPASERAGAVRRTSRLFVNGATLSVPLLAVVLRKAYGLGAMAMAGGSLADPMFTVSWPTGEFGGMGLEGAVRLAYRKELEAAPEGPARQALFEDLVGRLYASGKAVEQAAALQVDAVIDPAETRAWLVAGLKRALPRKRPPRRFIDAW